MAFGPETSLEFINWKLGHEVAFLKSILCTGANTFTNSECINARKTTFRHRCNLRNNMIDLEDCSSV
jgi:hypothetical protein